MRFISCIVLLLPGINLISQQNIKDSLLKIISKHRGDTAEVSAISSLMNEPLPLDSIINFALEGLRVEENLNNKSGVAKWKLIISSLYSSNANTIQSIQYALNALNDYEQLKDNTGIASAHLLLQGNYRDAEDYNSSLQHALSGEKIAERNNVKGVIVFPGHRLAPLFLAEISQTYILKNEPDSALLYAEKSMNQNELFSGTSWEFPIYLLATIQTLKGDYVQALENYRRATALAKVQPDNAHDTLQIYSGMSTLFKKSARFDSSIYYARIVQASWKPGISETKNLLEAISNLYGTYKLKGEKDSSLKYLELSYNLRDSIFNTEKQKHIQEVAFNEQIKQQRIIESQIKHNSRLQAYLFTVGIITLLLVAVLLIRNNKSNKKAKIKIEKAYTELKSTQTQLIQSEKMASLGELTAGIAHEIQNPLNFVNNFSEVNAEMVDEAAEEISKGNYDEAKNILNGIKDNSEKINHHGKRADAIVKNMLQHSRTSSRLKESTDINALCDEYLRLAYHGLRAKDKSFNTTINLDFDSSIGKINIIPQEIGRMLLNLYNNAFYAIKEKQKQNPGGYEPSVTVSTKKMNSAIEINVKDNDNGISQNIVYKIFQPFFTTKPTGQGTGLGLSLAYDIVKAHGGEIKVETKEGEGTEFIIQLPV